MVYGCVVGGYNFTATSRDWADRFERPAVEAEATSLLVLDKRVMTDVCVCVCVCVCARAREINQVDGRLQVYYKYIRAKNMCDHANTNLTPNPLLQTLSPS